MKNIEIKAKCENLDNLRSLVKESNGTYIETMKQRDTYFNAPLERRLKLRVFDNNSPKLVGYFRSDTLESKKSDWEATIIPNPDEFRSIMDSIYGILIDVIKIRELWIIKHTRVHLDQVENLGNFMELETLIDGISLEEGKKEHIQIIKDLNIRQKDLLEKSYSDILIEKNLKHLI